MAKPRKCKSCGNEITASAKICPHCGAKNKKFPIIPIVIVVFLLSCAIAPSNGKEKGDVPLSDQQNGVLDNSNQQSDTPFDTKGSTNVSENPDETDNGTVSQNNVVSATVETDIKELALRFCEDTYDMIKSSELSYSNYVNSFKEKVAAGEDAYVLSKNLYDFLNENLKFFHELDSSDVEKLDGFADYNYYTAAYVSGMLAVPKQVMDHLDGKDNINNYDSQKTKELIQGYKAAYQSSMVSFLESIGYTWDEVASNFYDWD